MATITPAQLVAPQQLSTTDTAFYTAPTAATGVLATTARIGRAVFTNTTSSAVTITAGITPGGPLGASTTMISAQSVAAGAAYVSPELAGAVIPAGSQLRGFAGAANSITFTTSGLTYQ
jgi:hypothetical protein